MRGGLYNPRPVDDIPVNGQVTHGVTSNRMFDHEADLDAHHAAGWNQAMTMGEYLKHTIISAGAQLADRLFIIPLWLPRTMTFDRIGINVTVAAAAGNSALVGIYNHGVSGPGTLLLDAGEIAIDAVALSVAVINQQLTPGTWWLAAWLEANITCNRGVWEYYSSKGIPAAAIGVWQCYADPIVYPAPAVLPDPCPAVDGDLQSSNGPYVFLRIASIP